MKKTDRIQCLLWALFGLYIAFEGVSAEIGHPEGAQGRVLIFWMGMIILILSILFSFRPFPQLRMKKELDGRDSNGIGE